MKALAMSIAIGVIAGCVGCVGMPYRFANVELDPERYEMLGYAEADTGGLMILNVIPSRQNNKIERAISSAIASKGGDELIDVTVQEAMVLGVCPQRVSRPRQGYGRETAAMTARTCFGRPPPPSM